MGELFARETKMAYQGGLQERMQEWRRRGCIDADMGDIFTTSRVACLLLVPLVDRPRFTEVVRSLGPTRAYPRCRCRCQAKSWLSWANLSIDCRQRHTVTCHQYTPALLPQTSTAETTTALSTGAPIDCIRLLITKPQNSASAAYPTHLEPGWVSRRKCASLLL